MSNPFFKFTGGWEISEAGKAGRQKPSKEQTETRWGRKQSGLPGQRRDRLVKNGEIDLKKTLVESQAWSSSNQVERV